MTGSSARTPQLATLRVLVVSDHSLVREGIVQLLRNSNELDVSGHALSELNGTRESFDVVLCIVEPRADLPALLTSVRQSYPVTNVLCLLLAQVESGAIEALRSGALGVIDDTFRPQNVVEAIKQVANGEMVLSNQLARRLASRFATPEPVARPVETDWELTPREVEVLRLLAEGYTNKDMAEQLSLSEHTIRAHLRGIMQKLHVSNRVQAAALAWQHRLADGVHGRERR